jgi:hypothetical protein
MSHNHLEVNTVIESILFYDDDLWPKQDMSGPGTIHLSIQNNNDIHCKKICFGNRRFQMFPSQDD